MTQTEFHHAKPVYEYLDGWWEDISQAQDLRRPAQGGAGLRQGASRSWPARRSARSASARAATRPSSSGRCCSGRSPIDAHRPGATARRRRDVRRRLARVRVLVIGCGGREHALVRALAADPGVTELHAAPGNPGIAELAELHAVTPPTRRPSPAGRAARRRPRGHRPGGAAGGRRRRRACARPGIACFGPDAAAARSRARRRSPRTSWPPPACPPPPLAPAARADEAAAALDAFGPPYVVKDDGAGRRQGRRGHRRPRRGARRTPPPAAGW